MHLSISQQMRFIDLEMLTIQSITNEINHFLLKPLIQAGRMLVLKVWISKLQFYSKPKYKVKFWIHDLH